MKPLIPTIPGGSFDEGDPSVKGDGTVVTDTWLNDMQDAVRSLQQEVIAVMGSAVPPVTADAAQTGQLREAINNRLGLERATSDNTYAKRGANTDITSLGPLTGDMSLRGNVTVGLDSDAKQLAVKGILDVSSSATLRGETRIKGPLIAESSASLQSGLTVSNGATLNGGVTVTNGLVAQSTANLQGGLTVSNGATINGATTINGAANTTGLAVKTSNLVVEGHVRADGAVQWGGPSGISVNGNGSTGDTVFNAIKAGVAVRLGVQGGYITRNGLTGSFGANVFNFIWRAGGDTSGFSKRESTGEVSVGQASVNAHQHYVMEAGAPGFDLFIDNSMVGRMAFTYTSDRQLKKDIVYQTDIDRALAEVNQWQPVSYTYKARGEVPEIAGKFGFIANDLATVSPETVKGKGLEEGADIEDPEVFKDAYELDAIAMVAKLTLAVQALTKRVEELESAQRS